MRQWRLTIAPSLRFTRIVLMDEAGRSVLRAHLPHGPQHPQAVQRLAEELSLWCGGPIHVVFAVDCPASSCAAHFTHQWQAALELLTRPPFYGIKPPEALQSDADMHRQLKARLPCN